MHIVPPQHVVNTLAIGPALLTNAEPSNPSNSLGGDLGGALSPRFEASKSPSFTIDLFPALQSPELHTSFSHNIFLAMMLLKPQKKAGLSISH